MEINFETVVTALTSAGGMTAMLAMAGRYFIVKLFKRFDEMSHDVADLKAISHVHDFNKMAATLIDIQMKLAVYEAVRVNERSNTERIEKLEKALTITESQMKAAWRLLDKYDIAPARQSGNGS